MDLDPAFVFLPLFFAVDLVLFAKVAALLLLLLFSALISGSEVALFSLTAADLDVDDAPIGRTHGILKKLLNKPKKLLATILVANNFINIAIVLLFSNLGKIFLTNIDYRLFGLIDLKFVVEVILVTFVILLFGEILPKVYASRNTIKFAHFMAGPLRGLDWIFTPVSNPMSFITVKIQEQLGKKKSSLSVDQLSQALELTSENDTTKEEKKILQGIVSFGNTDVKEVMQPRMDVFAIQKTIGYKELMAAILSDGYSRIPVFEESIDNVIGILYVKDLLPHIEKTKFDWQVLLRPPYFVPENKKLDDLLNDFKLKRNHLAIVVDEYGGTSGLITMEDIIEEIVGDISDEFDDEDLIYSKLDDRNFIFEGRTSLKDFYRVLQIEDTTIFEQYRGDAETIAGLLLEVYGSFPRKGEVIRLNAYSFKIEALDKKRIKQIKLTLDE